MSSSSIILDSFSNDEAALSSSLMRNGFRSYENIRHIRFHFSGYCDTSRYGMTVMNVFVDFMMHSPIPNVKGSVFVNVIDPFKALTYDNIVLNVDEMDHLHHLHQMAIL